MGRKKKEATRPPIHEEVKARNPLRGRNLKSYKTSESLKTLCSSCGLGASGTIPEMRKDLEIFKALDWGGETKKVTVAGLRNAQGPSAIFDGVPRTPEAIFDIFFTDEMWNLLVEETNRYKPRNVCLWSCKIELTFSNPS